MLRVMCSASCNPQAEQFEVYFLKCHNLRLIILTARSRQCGFHPAAIASGNSSSCLHHRQRRRASLTDRILCFATLVQY